MTSLFAPELIDLGFVAADKVQAVRLLAQMVLDAHRGTDLEQIVADVIARDEIGTPQFDGVAIPHARTAGVSMPSVVVARSIEGVTFDAEQPPADVIMMILVPETSQDQHIAILSQLARRLMNPDFTSSLRTSETADTLTALLREGEEA